MKKTLVIFGLLFVMLPPAVASRHSSTYRNSDNVRVHRPTKKPHSGGTYRRGATAVCTDGTYSYSQHTSGTCSHHGGVKRRLR